MAKGQKRSTREKKKPKANKKVVVPASSGFSSSLGQHKPDKARGTGANTSRRPAGEPQTGRSHGSAAVASSRVSKTGDASRRNRAQGGGSTSTANHWSVTIHRANITRGKSLVQPSRVGSLIKALPRANNVTRRPRLNDGYSTVDDVRFEKLETNARARKGGTAFRKTYSGNTLTVVSRLRKH